ncbi:MAG TPA: TIGR04372 family glycosyltransferase [Gammaproteobacteria bacterium]|nr:TIGR04372 family glycosyltransferase [Gammaproteobacteria bacterium]
MWKRVLFIVPYRRICFQIDRLLTVLQKEKYLDDPVKQFEYSSHGYDQWGFYHTLRAQKPYLKFTYKEIKKGEFLLQKLGITQGSRFICLLVRDSKYLQIQMNNDGSYDRYRDANIVNYNEAITLLTNKGYYVVRMGKVVDKKLDLKNNLVIDYANHPLRSDFLDIFLAAHCYFFISSSTGLDCIPRILGRPLLLTNYPLSDFNFTNYDMYIPKLVRSINEDRLLTFNEIFLIFHAYKKQGVRGPKMINHKWEFIENTPDDITNAVEDMVHYLSNQTITNEEKILQSKFWEYFPLPLPIPYDEITKLRVSPRFLKKYYSLLQ